MQIFAMEWDERGGLDVYGSTIASTYTYAFGGYKILGSEEKLTNDAKPLSTNEKCACIIR